MSESRPFLIRMAFHAGVAFGSRTTKPRAVASALAALQKTARSKVASNVSTLSLASERVDRVPPDSQASGTRACGRQRRDAEAGNAARLEPQAWRYGETERSSLTLLIARLHPRACVFAHIINFGGQNPGRSSLRGEKYALKNAAIGWVPLELILAEMGSNYHSLEDPVGMFLMDAALVLNA